MLSTRFIATAIFAQALYCAGAERILIRRSGMQVQVTCKADASVSKLEDLEVTLTMKNVGDRTLHIYKGTTFLDDKEKRLDVLNIHVDGAKDRAKYKRPTYKVVKAALPDQIGAFAKQTDLHVFAPNDEFTATLGDIGERYHLPPHDEKNQVLTISAFGAIIDVDPVTKASAIIEGVKIEECNVTVEGSRKSESGPEESTKSDATVESRDGEVADNE